MNRPFKQLFAFLILSFVALDLSPVYACSVCGSGDPLQATGTTRPMRDNWWLSFEAVYLTAVAQSDDNPLQTENLIQKTLNTILTYSPTNNLTFVGIVPFTEKDWVLSAASDGSDQAALANPIGLGDLNLGLRYFLIAEVDFSTKISQNFAITAGTTIPTGDENAVDSNGDRFDQHAQLGTGEWGPYGGIFYSILLDDWTFSANFDTLFHAVNAYQYHFGTSFNWGAQAMLRFNDAFALSLGTEGRYADHDTSNEVVQTNTGGTVMDITPGISWSPLDGWGLYSRVQIPVITDLFGSQSVGATAILGSQFLIE